MTVDNACVRCGGRHAARQRCPADGPPPSNTGWFDAGTMAAQPFELHGLLSVPTQSAAPVAVAPATRRSSPIRAVGSSCGGLVGTVAIVSCVSVAGTYITRLTQLDAAVGVAISAIIASIVVGLLLGVLLLWVSARLYAKVAFS